FSLGSLRPIRTLFSPRSRRIRQQALPNPHPSSSWFSPTRLRGRSAIRTTAGTPISSAGISSRIQGSDAPWRQMTSGSTRGRRLHTRRRTTTRCSRRRSRPARGSATKTSIMPVDLKRTDVVIVGLGAAGGVAALPIAQAGLDVVGLEAGTWLKSDDFAPDELRNNFRGWPQAVQKANREVPTHRRNATAPYSPR